MADSQHWTFIGAGNMASSLIGGMLASGASSTSITVIDINQVAIDNVQKRFGVRSAKTVSDAPQGSGFVLAVKPNTVESVCKELASCHPAIVISVAAGVRADSMGNWLPANTPVVRCMPNTPALLGLGATALYANDACTQSHQQQAEAMLASAGITEWVADEALLDAVTALSGSGPAYFFYLIENMAHTGEALGLSAEVARNLAIETAFGAASMARMQQQTPAQLRQNVTSKGGTTAAALAVFEQQNLPETVAAAMQAAHDRAIEMGNEFGGAS